MTFPIALSSPSCISAPRIGLVPPVPHNRAVVNYHYWWLGCSPTWFCGHWWKVMCFIFLCLHDKWWSGGQKKIKVEKRQEAVSFHSKDSTKLEYQIKQFSYMICHKCSQTLVKLATVKSICNFWSVFRAQEGKKLINFKIQIWYFFLKSPKSKSAVSR
jgi:hypothetical protein